MSPCPGRDDGRGLCGACSVVPSVRSGTSSLELLSDSEKLAFEAKRFWGVY